MISSNLEFFIPSEVKLHVDDTTKMRMPLTLNARRESGFWLKIPLMRYGDYMIHIRNIQHDKYLIMRFSLQRSSYYFYC